MVGDCRPQDERQGGDPTAEAKYFCELIGDFQPAGLSGRLKTLRRRSPGVA
jgi:hypothetical protein